MRLVKTLSLVTAAALASGLLASCRNGDETTASSVPAVSSEVTSEATSDTSDTAETAESQPAETSGSASAQRSQYTADLTITKPEHIKEDLHVTGHESIAFTNDSGDTWNEICIRDYNAANIYEARKSDSKKVSYKDLHTAVTGIRQSGSDLSFSESDDHSVLMVKLDKPLAPGESTTVEIDFDLSVPYSSVRQSYNSADHTANHKATDEDLNDLVVALGPFLPTLAAYDEKGWADDPYFAGGECFYTKCSDYRVHVNVPEGFELVASGTETKNTDGSFDIAADNVRDLALIAGDELVYSEDTSEGKVIRSWYPKSQENIAKLAEEMRPAAVNSVKAFTAQFGEYLYDELDVVYCAFDYGGMEYPGMVRINDSYAEVAAMDAPEEIIQTINDNTARTVAHEIGHEWFYAAVGDDQYNEAWLDEGFASFTEIVYMESVGTDKNIIDMSVKVMRATYELCGSPKIDQSVRDLTKIMEFDYSTTVYYGGASFLYDLRDKMGKDSFDGFMRQWYNAKKGGIATTREFLDMLYSVDDSEEVHKLTQKYFVNP